MKELSEEIKFAQADMNSIVPEKENGHRYPDMYYQLQIKLHIRRRGIRSLKTAEWKDRVIYCDNCQWASEYSHIWNEQNRKKFISNQPAL